MAKGHTVTLRLRGMSMRPFLEDNRDKVLMKKATDPHVGDPVLAEITPGHYVLHRIIDIKNNDVTLRGDGNISTEHCHLNDVKQKWTRLMDGSGKYIPPFGHAFFL